MKPKRKIYPTVEEIIQANKDILAKLKVYKAEKFGLLAGRHLIEEILQKVKRKHGDVYDKAIILLKELIIRHPFESANRRTAVVVTAVFLDINRKKINIIHDTNILQGIREGYYKDEEIKGWLKGGKMRAFKR